MQIKAIEEQKKKQAEALKQEKNQELETIEGLFPKKLKNN